jgi:ATP-binding cassette subfamily C protein
MIRAIGLSLGFMTKKEKFNWFSLLFLRATLSLFDLAGVLAVGFLLTSAAYFFTVGSDPDRTVEFAGLTIPAVNSESVTVIAIFIVSLFVGKAVLSIVLTKRIAFLVAKVEARSAKTIAEISFAGDLDDARKRSRDENMYAIQGGSPAAFNVLLNSAATFLTEGSLFLVICLGFFIVDPLSTIAAIVYFSFVAWVMHFFVGAMMGRAGQVQTDSTINANVAISDLLSVFRELVVTGGREKYIEKIYRSRLAAADASATMQYLSGMPRYIIEAALLLGIGLFAFTQFLSGNIVQAAGTMGVFVTGGFRLTAALLPLQNSLLVMKSIIPNAKTAHDVLSQTPPLERVKKNDSSAGDSFQPLGPIGVKFEDVSFRYPSSKAPNLKHISLEISPGSQVALMGPSGSGKSTIADLICSVLKPSSGLITYSLGDQREASFQGRIGYVPQRPGLVSGSILDNITLGLSPDSIDRLEVQRALKLAHLETVLARLPLGIDTPLGKLTDGLSGGQIQRLGLARALYRRPGLLVMDEATSALDAESEAEIQSALDEMRGEVTVVVIAHRLNTIQHSDKVHMLEEGQIVDSGRFHELVERNKSVERLVNLMAVDSRDPNSGLQ